MLFQTPLDRLERWLKILLGKKSTPGPLPRAALPDDTVAAILAALRTKQEPQRLLSRKWRGYFAQLGRQPDTDLIASLEIGADLQMELEPGELQDEDQVYATVELPDRSRVNIGYLTSVGDIRGALRRGWVRCWFAETRPTTAHPTGAAVIFIVVYDPR